MQLPLVQPPPVCHPQRRRRGRRWANPMQRGGGGGLPFWRRVDGDNGARHLFYWHRSNEGTAPTAGMVIVRCGGDAVQPNLGPIALGGRVLMVA
jgi:hypothetical protein